MTSLEATVMPDRPVEPAGGVGDRPRVFHLVMQAWGPAYCRMLTETCLPALLAPGNIPALAAEWPAKFIIFTRDQDIRRITDSPSYARLAAILPVEFKTIDEELRVNKYAALTMIHHRVLGTAWYEQAAVVWLVPDAIWSDGSLRTVSRAAAAGKRAVMQPALRVVKDDAMPAVKALLGAPGFDGFAARDLARLALDHMHPYYRACYWNEPLFNTSPALVFWPVGNEGVAARGFHLHPLMLFPSKPVRAFNSTFDDDLPLLACPDVTSIHIVTDSDDAFHIDLTDDDWCELIPRRAGYGSVFRLLQFALSAANLHHRKFAESAIRIHAVECSDAWAAAVKESDRAIAWLRFWIVLAGMARLPIELAFGHRRSTYLSGRPVQWKDKTSTFKPARAFFWLRRQAYLFACGWVFGRTVACQQAGLDPWGERRWIERMLEFYYQRVFQPYIYPLLLWIDAVLRWCSDWWKLKKKRARSRRRHLRVGAEKFRARQILLARDRLKKRRKALRLAWNASWLASALAAATRRTSQARKRSALRIRRARSTVKHGLDLRGRRRKLQRALNPRPFVRSAERAGSKALRQSSRTVRKGYQRIRGIAAWVIRPARR